VAQPVRAAIRMAAPGQLDRAARDRVVPVHLEGTTAAIRGMAALEPTLHKLPAMALEAMAFQVTAFLGTAFLGTAHWEMALLGAVLPGMVSLGMGLSERTPPVRRSRRELRAMDATPSRGATAATAEMALVNRAVPVEPLRG
jgi:hypothetical protein